MFFSQSLKYPQSYIHRIGWCLIFCRNPLYLMVKSMVSSKGFPLSPSIDIWHTCTDLLRIPSRAGPRIGWCCRPNSSYLARPCPQKTWYAMMIQNEISHMYPLYCIFSVLYFYCIVCLLCCTVLYCVVLYCVVLYCVVLYCVVLCCVVF